MNHYINFSQNQYKAIPAEHVNGIFHHQTLKNSFYDNQIQSSNLQSKRMKVDRYESNSAKFYFLDFFDELVYFDYCELIVFISNK